MARIKATAGYTVFPKPQRKTDRLPCSDRKSKIWSLRANEQVGCPLFNEIATEIRFSIYRYALFVLDDRFVLSLQQTAADGIAELPERTTSIERLIYRPPLRKRGYVEQHPLSLLQTCQAIYSEACDLAVAINTHVFLYPRLYALSFPIPTQATDYFSRMKGYQIEQVRHIQLFVNASRFSTFSSVKNQVGGYRSETPFAEIALLRNGGGFSSQGKLSDTRQYKPIHPLSLTITIRDYDWHYSAGLSRGAPSTEGNLFAAGFLRNNKWENLFGSLQCLKMELEMETSFKHRLKGDILKLMAYEFDVGNNRKLVAGPNSVFESCWQKRDEEGPTTGEAENNSGNLPSMFKELTVYTIVWNLVST